MTNQLSPSHVDASAPASDAPFCNSRAVPMDYAWIGVRVGMRELGRDYGWIRL